MTEAEARAWIDTHFGVSRGTLLARFVELVRDESTRQNLVSAASLDHIWARHIVDSAQLVPMAESHAGSWVDIGSGAGLPGIVVAALTDRQVTLVEPRRKRVEFLNRAAEILELGGRVQVIGRRAEQIQVSASIISARAVAALSTLLAAAAHLSTRNTLWLLPKGQLAAEEVAAARQTWHGTFHVEQSITDPRSMIITAKGVARR